MFAATVEYASRDESINAMKNLRLATNGTSVAMDHTEALASATTSVDRMYCPGGTARIVLSRFAIPPFHADTRKISCPTLVLHGDQDPIFSLEHGRDIASTIPGAELVVLVGAGHNHPLTLQPEIASHIAAFSEKIFN